ncbi:unnamed protein product, partial [Pylaiella littoralis]
LHSHRFLHPAGSHGDGATDADDKGVPGLLPSSSRLSWETPTLSQRRSTLLPQSTKEATW